MSDLLLQFNSLWFWILVALALIILLGVVIVSSVVRGAKTEQATPATEHAAALPAPGQQAEVLPPEETTPAESPKSSFARALRFLRSTVSGRDYRYQIPWYLVIGDRNSGKSALMRSVGIDLAASERGSRSSLKWRFLDRGILIGVSGRFMRGSGRAEHDWSALLRLFQNNRPRRPLDGIVLTVAASDLTGPAALDETQLSARAGRFSEMLAQAQRTFGFVFPVYVIVTKCDEIEGFSAFCRELPSRNRDDIFGWSSPYQLDASFAPEWVDEAFNGISQDLQRLQSEILVERSELRDPDAVFLFPEEFVQMRSSLGIYLERLFRETAYREAFRFRGLYFCGDVSEPPAPEPKPEDGEMLPIEHLLPEIAPPSTQQPVLQLVKSPIFVKRLFEEKIFSECGLGRPLARVFLTKSRTVSYIQGAAALFALVLLAGTWFSTRRLSGDRDRILPALEKMTYSLPKSEGPSQRRAFGLGLLKSLDVAANVHFWSVFQPASWFSPMDDNVTLVMKVACEQWVFSAIQAELTQRKTALLYPQPAPPPEAAAAVAAKPSDAPTDDSAAGPLEPAITGLESAPEYQSLSMLVSQLQSLEEATAIYESLRQQNQTATPDRIGKLLSYLDLSDVRPSGHLALALMQATGPAATFTATDIAAASDSVRKLIGDLLRDWFENNEAWEDVEQLRQSISDLQRGRATTYDQLKNLIALIGQVQNDFTDPNFRWLGNTNLDLPASLQRVSANPLAGPKDTELVSYARLQGDGYFTRLRNNLRDERTPLTGGALLDLKNPIDLSAGSKQLQVALENTLNLPFMGEPVKPDPIQITLEANRRLMWRLDPLHEAQRLAKFYTDFVQDGLRGAPPALVGSLSHLALAQLTGHVQTLIVQAQTFQPRSAAMSSPNGDDETLPEVNAFRDAASPLEQLSEQFNGLGQTYIHNAVLRIMVLQAYNLLSTIDSRLKSEQPYAIKTNAWNGAGALSFAVFGVTSQQAMSVYLGAQRDRVKFFEQQTEPLVPFLVQYMPVQATDQTQLINKWKGIIDDYQQYASKGTASTLAALEDFISTGIDKIPAAACKAGTPEGGTDYFVQIHNNLATQLSNRCRDVTASTVCAAYGGIAADFNGKLANRFPFSPDATITNTEAAPEDIMAFYKTVDEQYKTAHGGLKASLDDDTRFGDDGHKARAFLDQVDDLRTLAIPSTPETAKELPFAMDVVPKFRTNRAQEVGGNQVIDWTMQVGGQIFQSKDPEHPGRWRASNPVRLSLRWANDSAYQPAPDPSQPDLTIRGRNAYYEFANEWAMLAFLRRHEALPSDLGQSAEPAPYTLKFHVKTVIDPKWAASGDHDTTGSATLFLYLKVTPAGGKDPIRIPPIPVAAPQLATGCAPL